jgi:hypothetical protein
MESTLDVTRNFQAFSRYLLKFLFGRGLECAWISTRVSGYIFALAQYLEIPAILPGDSRYLDLARIGWSPCTIIDTAGL